MASNTAADGTEDTGGDEETLEQVKQKLEDAQNRLEEANDRLETLTENIAWCDSVLEDLNLLRALLLRKSLQDMELPLQK